MRGVLRLLVRFAALLALLAIPAHAPTAERYVALGDSYSAGTGAGSYGRSRECQRSRLAYPALVARRRPSLKLVFAACAGATTGDVLRSQVSRVDEATRLVTITIGGNDAGFAVVIGSCAESGATCAPALDHARRFIRDELPARLDAVYAAIRRRARRAKVVVLGYPRLFAATPCGAAPFFTRAELRQLNRTADLLRDTIRARVTAAGHGFAFRDAVAPFAGHEICSRRPWLNGLTSSLGDSFHPNAAGHERGYARLVLSAIR